LKKERKKKAKWRRRNSKLRKQTRKYHEENNVKKTIRHRVRVSSIPLSSLRILSSSVGLALMKIEEVSTGEREEKRQILDIVLPS
jgi:hypothetical protein